MLTFLASEASLKFLHEIVQPMHDVFFLTIPSFSIFKDETGINSDCCKSTQDMKINLGPSNINHELEVPSTRETVLPFHSSF